MPKLFEKETREAVQVILADLAGHEDPKLYYHIIWLATLDDHLFPADLEGAVDRDALKDKLLMPIYDKMMFSEGTEADYLCFRASIQSPMDVSIAGRKAGLKNMGEYVNNLFAKFDKPIDNVTDATMITYMAGPDAPKYFDALKYIVEGEHEDVSEDLLANTLDLIDEFCASMGITIPEVNGVKQYSIDNMIDQALAIAKQEE